MARIYLAGGLFNAAERVHNILLEPFLVSFGHNTVLPQRREQEFYTVYGKYRNAQTVALDCEIHCTDDDFVTIACIDGADADSGTSVEVGMAKIATGRAIVYRTDFRTTLESQVGVNWMFSSEGIRYVYYPCHLTEQSEIPAYYEELARRIHVEIEALPF